MAKRESPSVQAPLAKLRIPRSTAAQRIREQVERGRQILDGQTPNDEALAGLKAQRKQWTEYVRQMLRTIFDNDTVANEFRGYMVMMGGYQTADEEIEQFRKDLSAHLVSLGSILNRLDLFEDLAGPPTTTKTDTHSNKVFVVHGHDEGAKQQVARLLERLKLDPVILHEQPNQSRTIIEKLENYSDVGFAVVLLTGDDEGRAKTAAPPPSPRARQNVILEMGYFLGKLGRSRVCPLHVAGVELPSDFSGVVYTPLDPGGSWQFALAKELRAAGYSVDMNTLC